MKKNSVFFETFVSEYVEIVQDFEITTSFNLVEDQAHPVKMPMTVNGFVMDSDDDFLYLSPDGEEINQALPIRSIKHIAIIDVTKEQEDSMLDMFEVPDDKSGYN